MTLVKNTDYTVTEGSTIITITKAGLEKLGTGTHSIKIFFTDGGTAVTTLTILAGGLSGGATAGIVIGSVAVLAAAGFCAYWFVIKKKKFSDLFGKKA